MSDLTRLKGADKLRKRVGVMLGSDDIRGVQQTLFEIISNSIDRFKKGYGDKIIITRHKDNSFTIQDFADGLPMKWNEKEQAYNWELALRVLYAGDNYEQQDDNTGTLGFNGLGLTSTQFSSEYMNVDVVKDGIHYMAKFKKGRPVDFNTEKFIREDEDILFTKEEGKKVLFQENIIGQTGTKINYRPDLDVFTDINIPSEWIQNKLKKQSVVNVGLEIIFKDELLDKTFEYNYSGLEEYLEEISNGNNLTDIIKFAGSGEGQDTERKPIYKLDYEFVFSLNNDYPLAEYFHNSSELTELTKNVTTKAIETAFTKAIHNYLTENKMYKKSENKVKFSDIEDSLICVLNSKSTYTSYANQTKLSIDNRFIKEFIEEDIEHKLTVFFIENKIQADKICNQVLINKRAREESDSIRKNAKKKLSEKVDGMVNRVEKLTDCKYHDERSEIFIAEGESAKGSIVLARNPKIQAVYPLKGKILSCLKASYEEIFSNEVIIELIKVLGCGVEVKSKHNKELNNFDISKLRYGKVVIATDEDFDGYNIRVLILTMIYRLMPELIHQGKIYISQTPLFVLKNKDKVYYAFNEKDKERILKELTGKVDIGRAKGLGELDAEDMYHTAINPETRSMIKVTVGDVEKMIKNFELWMGENVEPRRQYIAEHLHEYFSYEE